MVVAVVKSTKLNVLLWLHHGTLGAASVVKEKQCFSQQELAIENKQPLIIVAQGGGIECKRQAYH